ncbi:hypothetical protein, partial [Pseudodesulfovibrio pelocollis]|uniref:hypothetical protein n=1 Tax=Pseudodesulfovibrio pelocollis TaxID=3051432 RepID=UPI00255A8B2C
MRQKNNIHAGTRTLTIAAQKMVARLALDNGKFMRIFFNKKMLAKNTGTIIGKNRPGGKNSKSEYSKMISTKNADSINPMAVWKSKYKYNPTRKTEEIVATSSFIQPPSRILNG